MVPLELIRGLTSPRNSRRNSSPLLLGVAAVLGYRWYMDSWTVTMGWWLKMGWGSWWKWLMLDNDTMVMSWTWSWLIIWIDAYVCDYFMVCRLLIILTLWRYVFFFSLRKCDLFDQSPGWLSLLSSVKSWQLEVAASAWCAWESKQRYQLNNYV